MFFASGIDPEDLLEIIKRIPVFGMGIFYSTGWRLDKYGYDIISRDLALVNDDYADMPEELTIPLVIATAFVPAICHINQKQGIDVGGISAPDKVKRSGYEVLMHAVFHPEGLCTIINLEHDTKLVTDSHRGSEIVMSYASSFKEVPIESVEFEPFDDDNHRHVFIMHPTDKGSLVFSLQEQPSGNPFDNFIQGLDMNFNQDNT